MQWGTLRVIAALILLAAVLAAVPADAVEIPTPGSTAFQQTTGRDAGLNIGDWYTNATGGDTSHLVELEVGCNWPETTPITVSLFDPELNTGHGTATPFAIDEVRGTADTTRFRLFDPLGNEMVPWRSFASAGGSDGLWVELVTFLPASLPAGARCGTFELETEVSDGSPATPEDDDNSWRLRLNHDPDCGVTPGTCSTLGPAASALIADGDEVSDADGLVGTGDELAVGYTRASQQHGGAGLTCQDYFFFDDGSSGPSFTVRNFDMDNSGSITYYPPSGTPASIAGTTSSNAAWANDSVSSDLGWWRAEVCINSSNQYIFDGISGRTVYFDQPPSEPRLRIAKDDGITTAVAGETVTWTITLQNDSVAGSGGAPAFDVVVRDTLPAGTTFASCSIAAPLTGSCSEAGGVVTLSVNETINPQGVVAPNGGTVSVSATIDDLTSGVLTNTARIDYADPFQIPMIPDISTHDLTVNPSIGDFVWNDLDGDGVQDAGEPGIDGVAVTLWNATETAVIATSTTAGGGRYVFTGVAPGDYVVEFGLPSGLIPTAVDRGTDTTDSDADRTSLTAPVTLGAGASDGSIDAGFVAPASIGDLVWNDQDGSGDRDPGELGINGVIIRLYSPGPDGTLGTADDVLVGTTATAGGGAYSFDNLLPDTFRVDVDQTTLPPGISLLTTGSEPLDLVVGAGSSNTAADFGYRAAQADLSITKVDDADPQRAGSQITYTIEVTNVGLDTASSVEVTDTLPAGVSFNSTAPAGLCLEAPVGTLTCDLGDLAVGTSSFDVVVDIAGTTSGTITNAVSVAASTPDPVPGNNTATAATLVLNPALSVVKTTSTPVINGGGTASYLYGVENTGNESFAFPAALSISDDACAPVTGPTAGDTNANSILEPGETWTFACSTTLAADTTNTVTVTASSAVGPAVQVTDQAAVDVRPSIAVTKAAGSASVPEPGTTVTFTVTVENTSQEDVTVDSITDSDFGDVLDPANPAISATTCAVSTVVAPGAGNAYSCTFDALVSGDASGPGHTNTVIVGASDDEGNTATDSDGASVSISDVLPSVAVTKTANPSTVPAAGAEVTFLVRVDNTSVEPVTLGSLADSIYGNVADAANVAITGTTCSVPQVIGVSGFYACSFTAVVSGAPGGSETDTVTATATDNETNTAVASDSATVTLAAGSVGDLVWLDLDGDGLQDGGPENGIAGVNVGLYLDVDSSGTVNAGDVLLGTETTDGAGAFDFTGLLAGDYLVVPDSSGLPPSYTLTGGSNPTVVSLGVDEDFDGADFGYQPLGSIGDFVWFDRNGDGVQDGGTETGIAGVTVDLFLDDDSSGTVTSGDTFIGTRTTDGTGAYDFTGLATGDYVATITDTGGALPAGTLTGGSDPAVVSLSPGQDYDLADFGWQASASIGDFVWDDLDADGSQDPGEPGLGGVTVELLAGAVVINSASTVAGAYAFTDVAPGTYTVRFTAPPGRVFSTPSTLPVTVTAGQVVDMADAGLYSPASIGDRVWVDLDSDGVQDPGEPGLPGVTVRAFTASDLINPVATDTTDATGGYSFDTLAPGAYRIRVIAPGAGVFTASGVGADSTADSDVDAAGWSSTVTLVSGGSNTAIDAGVLPSLIGDRVWVDPDINGIQDPGESGVAGIVLNLLDGGGAPVLDGSGSAISVSSDASGSYTFAVAPGTYTVEIDVPSGAALTLLDAGADDDVDSDFGPLLRTAPITVGVGENLDGAADAGIRPPLVGDFVWEDTNRNGRQDSGEPGLSGVVVTAYASDDVGGTAVATTVTDASGFYILGLPVGSYRLVVTAPAETRFTAQAAPAATPGTDSDVDAAGVTDPIDLSQFTIDFDGADAGLVRLGSIGDRVFLDANGDGTYDPGEGIPDITVTLTLPDLSTVTTSTDANGFYEFSGLEAGAYSVAVDESDADFPAGLWQSQGTNPISLTLTVGEVVDTADFGYRQTGSIGDLVWLDLDGDGVPDGGSETGVSGVTVDLYDDADSSGTVTAGDALVGTATTGAAGAFDFTGLIPGAYVVTVTDTGAALPPSVLTGGSDPRAVTLAAAEDFNTADFGFQPYVTLGDRVWLDVDGDGIQDGGETSGVAGVVVDLVDPGPDATPGTLDDVVVDSDTTDGAGAYSLTGPAGTYVVGFSNLSPGFVLSPADQGGGDALDSDATPATGFTTPITLTGGGTTSDVDAGVFEPALIGDRVFVDLNENGSFDAGEGIPNITVNLSDGQSAVTDANGRYQFSAVAGSYTVSVDEADEDFPVDALLTVGSNPATVTIAAGEVNGSVDFGYIIVGPAVQLEKGPATQTILVGTDASFTITVTNIGNVDLAGVTVSDVAAPGCDAVIGGLPRGTSTSYACTVAGVGADFVNSATLTATPPIGPAITASDTAAVDVVDPGISIGKDPATQTIRTGTDASFTITVTNTGDVDLSNVAVTDPATPACDSPIGLLPVGGIVTYSCDAVAVSAGFTNTATVSADGPLGALAPVTASAVVTVDEATVTVDQATVAGRVWLDLNGDGSADGAETGAGGLPVQILDGSLTVVASTSTDGNGDYRFGGLDAGTYTIVVDAAALPGGSVATGDPDGALDGRTTLTVSLGDNLTDLDFGYQPPASVAGVVFDDANENGVLDAGEVPLAGVTVILTPAGQPPISVATDAAGAYAAAVPPGLVTVDIDLATVPPGYTLTTSNTPQALTAAAGALTTASDIGYGDGAVDVALNKVSSESNVRAGDQIEYLLTVTNVGTVDAIGPITLTDRLPSGLDFVSAAGPGWACSAAGGVVTCTNPGPLAPGSVLTVTIVTDVASNISGTVVNPAEVAVAGDVNMLNNGAVASIGLLPNTGFELGDALNWAVLSLLLGVWLLLIAGRRRRDQAFVKKS